ncbi:chalcone isomerase family protein [Xylophilus sp.]|uniref:chalcone isomerase family protein n=1 Tax=Xylophilus sp. TaxID=2653893 RepID=UPI0013B9F04D|nr:chalcone isomerase family protein [Xylophilus sp.]KAF1045004.1 MAG: hypothetical protein GAK38_03230 [Xylophilus sp.]
MITPLQSAALAVASCIAAAAPGASQAANVGGVELEDSVQLAGRQLTLNGAGIGFRLVFKVYAIGLYLPDRRRTTEAVLATDGPRRLFITLLRDVTAEEFEEAILDGDDTAEPAIAAQLAQLGRTIASRARGLRRGDLLTLDWIPGTGTVVELNRKPLARPMGDLAFYNALLNIWLGEKPTDPALKPVLLGQARL